MGGLPILKAAGLQTAHNPFSSATPGGLSIARNVVIFSNSIVEPRRGFKQLSYTYTAPDTYLSNSGTFFGTSLVFHSDTATLSYDTGSAFTAYSGTFTPVDDTLLRMKFVEAQLALHANTATGVKVLETATGAWRGSGLPRPRLISPEWSTSSARTYAATFIYTDTNGIVHESEPSSVVEADSGDTTSGTVYFVVDTTVPTGTKLRIYTTAVDSSSEYFLTYEIDAPLEGDDPGSDMYLVEIANISLSDVALYTNARTGDGALSANTQPPIAKDMTTFGGRTWFANTTARHRITFDMLGVGSPDGVQAGDTVTIAGYTYTATSDEETHNNEPGYFGCREDGTPTQNIVISAQSLAAAINQLTSTTGTMAIWVSPGTLIIESTSLGDDSFTVYASRADSWNPVLPTTALTALNSTAEELKNGLFYSKHDQPESVPLLNYLLIGAKNKQILRVVPLREKLFVLKEDGIYTVAGDEPFSVDLLDATTRLVAPDSAAVLNNQIYALTNQGVVSVSDAGVQVLSRGIEDSLLPYLNAAQRNTIRRSAFALGHETDRTYELWLPGPGVTDSRVCNIAYVWNTMTQSWTAWDGSERNWGAVDTTDVRYYGGTSGKVLKERRDFVTSDYADETFDVVVSGYSGTTITVGTTVGIDVGDALCVMKAGTTQATTITAIPSATTLTVSESILTSLQTGNTTVIDKAFETEVRWLSITFDHPASLKRFQYGTLHFTRGSAFYNGYAVYSTEMASGINVETVSQSTLGWGTQAWGSSSWGDTVPVFNMRHVIPIEKQRATGLSPGFKLREARKGFKLLGLTLDTEETSERGSY